MNVRAECRWTRLAKAVALCGLAAGGLLSACSSDNPVSPPRAASHARAAAPGEATSLGPARDDAPLDVFVSLEQRVTAAELHEMVLSETAPSAGKCADPVTLQDVVDRVGATPEAVRTATGFFAGRGLEPEVDATGTYLHVRMTVGDARDLFGTQFHQYSDDRAVCQAAERPPYVACSFVAPAQGAAVFLPEELLPALPEDAEPIQCLYGLSTRTVYTHPQSAAAAGGAGPGLRDISDPGAEHYWAVSGTRARGCDWANDTTSGPLMFTPDQIRTAYGFPATKIAEDRSLALLEFGRTVCQSDVDPFAECFGLTAPTLVHVDGEGGGCSGLEATTDAAAVVGMADGHETLYVVQGSMGSQGDFQQTLSRALAIGHAPSKDDAGKTPVDVISISYGACEKDFEQSFNASVADMEKIFAKAALACVTVVTGSADYGSAGPCNSMGPYSDTAVVYPASSRYVTSVGGTTLYLDEDNTIHTSRVWNDTLLYYGDTPSYNNTGSGGGYSGEGVSAVKGLPVPRPSWQTGEGVDTSEGATRQVPDVAYFGSDFPGTVSYAGSYNPGASGTSYAAPLFGAAALHYNNANARRLGFANPDLYAGVQQGTLERLDIVKLNNKMAAYGSKTWKELDCCDAGPGYDRATGLGSIFVDSLIGHVPGASAEAR